MRCVCLDATNLQSTLPAGGLTVRTVQRREQTEAFIMKKLQKVFSFLTFLSNILNHKISLFNTTCLSQVKYHLINCLIGYRRTI